MTDLGGGSTAAAYSSTSSLPSSISSLHVAIKDAELRLSPRSPHAGHSCNHGCWSENGSTLQRGTNLLKKLVTAVTMVMSANDLECRNQQPCETCERTLAPAQLRAATLRTCIASGANATSRNGTRVLTESRATTARTGCFWWSISLPRASRSNRLGQHLPPFLAPKSAPDRETGRHQATCQLPTR